MIRPISFNGVYKINNASQSKTHSAACQINNTIGINDESLGYEKLDREISEENPCFFACRSEFSPGYILTGEEAKTARKFRDMYENSMDYFHSYYGDSDMLTIEHVMAAETFYGQICDIVEDAHSKGNVEELEMEYDEAHPTSLEEYDRRPKFNVVI